MTDANSSMLIFKTDHWIIKHRADSKLPGYLILVSKNQSANSLSDLSDTELNELVRYALSLGKLCFTKEAFSFVRYC